MKNELNSEREELMEKYKLMSHQNEITRNENKSEKEGLEHFKETLYQREIEMLSKQEEHRSLMAKEHSEIEIQKVSVMSVLSYVKLNSTPLFSSFMSFFKSMKKGKDKNARRKYGCKNNGVETEK